MSLTYLIMFYLIHVVKTHLSANGRSPLNVTFLSKTLNFYLFEKHNFIGLQDKA